MKKLILMAAFITASVLIASAQMTGKKPEQRAAHVTKVLQKRLNLTDGQAQQVNAIYFTQATRMDSLKSNPSEDKRLNRLTAHTITLTTRLHVMAILNESQKQQFTQWEEMVKQRQKAKRDTVGVRE
jgi:thiamine biosynthesis lipoprotein ApbE